MTSRLSDQLTDWEEARNLKAFREEVTEAIAKTLHSYCKSYDYMPSHDAAIEFLERFEEDLTEHLTPHEDWRSLRELSTREDDAGIIARKAWGRALEGEE
jgi:septation ring formation regulator EzrA